ncbi:DUF3800 domain-containing protein [Streptomyces sp. NBC_00160]|uniref:DUF3800 domain-containing protein n=1 Tax=Streptomyces sp. NBC_00160 TaxID=2903628 RepID=UPI00225A633A|nr:DUF3800 domain-containing protein [Streptomyces sp. NBC_00160]MCX5303176.1 DUF3800 domain-containing protein [Streptomyces sp. NBC_00160]
MLTDGPLQPSAGALPRVDVYVDETGDRGFSKQSSAFFAMTALMVPQEDDWNVRVTAGGLRALIHRSRPQNVSKPLHWVDHFKKKHPERRLYAARQLALMPSAKVVHVVAPKDDVRRYSGMKDGVRFYNYTTRILLERVAWAAHGWDGGARSAVVRLGSVKGMDHSDTLGYLDWVRQGRCETWGVPWRHIKWPPKWHGTDWDGIQLADIHAGLLNAALTGDPNDEACAENLLLCKHQLHRRAPGGTLLGVGVKVIGNSTFITGRAWWKKWAVA